MIGHCRRESFESNQSPFLAASPALEKGVRLGCSRLSTMSTECCSEWGEWDDQSFVLKTPLRDAFVARQIQHAFDLVPPNRRTRNREGAARAGDPLNEAVWVTGIAEEIKRRNAVRLAFFKNQIPPSISSYSSLCTRPMPSGIGCKYSVKPGYTGTHPSTT